MCDGPPFPTAVDETSEDAEVVRGIVLLLLAGGCGTIGSFGTVDVAPSDDAAMAGVPTLATLST